MQYLHVNLVDLVDTWRVEDPVGIFGTLEELRVYTCETGNVFDRESAYAGGVLSFLLREITGTYHGIRVGSRRGKGNRRGKARKKVA